MILCESHLGCRQIRSFQHYFHLAEADVSLSYNNNNNNYNNNNNNNNDNLYI